MVFPVLTQSQKSKMEEMCSNSEVTARFIDDEMIRFEGINTFGLNAKNQRVINIHWFEYLIMHVVRYLPRKESECWKDTVAKIIEAVDPMDGTGFIHPIDLAYKLYKKKDGKHKSTEA